MSHEDAVVKLPRDFKTNFFYQGFIKYTIIENTKKKNLWSSISSQVTHTVNGNQIFRNFLFSICKIKKSWNIVSQKKIDSYYQKNSQ